MASLEIAELNDLRPYTIGAATGYWYKKFFRDAGLTVDRSLKDLVGLRKLQVGRIDLYPVDKRVGVWLIDNHFAQERRHFGFLEGSLPKNQNGLIISKSYPNSQALLEAFNASLQRVREKSTYRRIMKRYGMDF